MNLQVASHMAHLHVRFLLFPQLVIKEEVMNVRDKIVHLPSMIIVANRYSIQQSCLLYITGFLLLRFSRLCNYLFWVIALFFYFRALPVNGFSRNMRLLNDAK